MEPQDKIYFLDPPRGLDMYGPQWYLEPIGLFDGQTVGGRALLLESCRRAPAGNPGGKMGSQTACDGFPKDFYVSSLLLHTVYICVYICYTFIIMHIITLANCMLFTTQVYDVCICVYMYR